MESSTNFFLPRPLTYFNVVLIVEYVMNKFVLYL
jgi:hypothetical protein